MSNTFRKYPRITNSYDAEFISKIKEHGLDRVEWAVSEKLHGANLSIHYDGTDFDIASRNGIITGDISSFYNIDSIEQKLYHIAGLLYDNFKDKVKVYGELVGGAYPHPKVQKQKIGMIQKGVYYCPGIEFSVFDIQVGDSFISVDELENICSNLNILYQHSLFRGTLSECLKFPNNNISIFSSLLGLPPIENNIMEGVVIKPVYPVFFGNTRVIVKNKNEQFKEKNIGKKKSLKEDLSPKMLEILENIGMYFNVNRLDSATSKLGPVSPPKIGDFIKELRADILSDIEIEDGYKLSNFSKDEQKTINKFINEESKKLILGRIKGEI